MDKIKKMLIVILMLPLLTTGCWDKVEIEERAFISATGIDVYEGDGEKGPNKIDAPKDTPRNQFVITYVFPNLDNIGKNAGGGPDRFILSSVGENPFETSRQISTRSDKVMFFKHMKVVILGEELAKNPDYMKEHLDALERHNEIGRKLNLMISEGTAKDVINIETDLEKVTGTFLSSLVGKKPQTARYNMLTFGSLLESLHASGNALIPRIVPGETEIKVAGSGVIRDYQLVGWLGEVENRAVMLMKDEFKSDVITVKVKDIFVPYVISYSKTSKEVKVEDDKIKFIIDIEMEGDISQFKLGTINDVMEEEFFQNVEKATKDEIEKEILSTVHKVQKEFKVDVIGVGDYLSKYKPKLWSSIKDDWENVFPSIEIVVNVDPKVRRVGLTR